MIHKSYEVERMRKGWTGHSFDTQKISFRTTPVVRNDEWVL